MKKISPRPFLIYFKFKLIFKSKKLFKVRISKIELDLWNSIKNKFYFELILDTSNSLTIAAPSIFVYIIYNKFNNLRTGSTKPSNIWFCGYNYLFLFIAMFVQVYLTFDTHFNYFFLFYFIFLLIKYFFNILFFFITFLYQIK